MKTFSTMAMTGALAGMALLLAGSPAGAQSRTIQGDSVTVTATIEAIDAGTRTLTVKNDDGTYESIVAPASMTRFGELKVGDKITARYYENVVVRLKRPNEAAVDVDSAALTRNTGAPGADGGDPADHDGDRHGEGPEDVGDHGARAEQLHLQPPGEGQEGVRDAQGRRPAGHDLDRRPPHLGRAAEEVDRRIDEGRRSSAHRSPTPARRSRIVRRVNDCGCTAPASTSSHVQGADTGAPGLARTV